MAALKAPLRPGLAWRLALALVFAWMLLAPARTQATLTAPRESAVKAAFLMKFGTFVDWPPEAFRRPDEPLVIGILGDDAVHADLEQLAQGRSVNGRPIVARRLREPPSQGERVHILFLATQNESRLRELLVRTTGPVLVVTQADAGLALGAALNFVLERGRVRFEASPRAAEGRAIKLSSRLLAVARAVEERAP
ncbi:MAG TPA: YfiR family protein [Ramlibacter sp.]